MSTYRVKPCKVSNTLNIYGPNGRTMGYIYGARTPRSERFKRFIEAHDEILAVLSETVRALGPRDRYDFVIKAEALIKQLNGEEAV